MMRPGQQLVVDPRAIREGDTVLDRYGNEVGVALMLPTSGGKGGTNIGVFVQQADGTRGMHYMQPGTPTTVVRP